MNAKIVGTGSYIPNDIWDNNYIATLVDTSDEWIRERTGVVNRHIATNVDTSMMATKAAMLALADSKVNEKDVDAVINCTMSADSILPSVACIVAKNIGADNAFAYDINAACSGFVFAYNTVLAYMACGMVKTALIIGAEKLSKVVNWTDRGTCILFGDGAGAVVLKSTNKKLYKSYTSLHTEADDNKALTMNQGEYIKMDGQQVFKFAVTKVTKVITELINKANEKIENIDYIVLHQANKRIVESVSKRVNVPIEKFPMNLMEYGNTSSASIPILLDEMNKSGKIKEGNTVIMAGFGAGLSFGGTLFKW